MTTKLRRNTRQRQAILEVLCATKSHPTAGELFQAVRDRLPRISLGTVYRNLEVLAQTGQVVRMHDGGPETRFDGNTAAHGHAHCSRCGGLADVEVVLPDLGTLHGTEVAGFLVTAHAVTLHGICASCRVVD